MKTISYIVYPAAYEPGDEYIMCDTKQKAVKIALAYGTGAELVQTTTLSNSRGKSYATTATWEVIHDTYFIERVRKLRHFNDNNTTAKIRNAAWHYTGIFRKVRK